MTETKVNLNKMFNEEINLILLDFTRLFKLTEYFNRVYKAGTHLHYERVIEFEDGQEQTVQHDIYKSDIKGLADQFRDRIKDLKQLFRRRKRETIDLVKVIEENIPLDEWRDELKGQNALSVATKPLVNYINKEDLGRVGAPVRIENGVFQKKEGVPFKGRHGDDLIGKVINPNAKKRFQDILPHLSKGYFLKAGFSMIFFHAIRVADARGDEVTGGHGRGRDDYDGDHRKNYFTEAMIEAFGTGVTPYVYDDSSPPEKIPNTKYKGHRLNDEQIAEFDSFSTKMSTIEYLMSVKFAPEVDGERNEKAFVKDNSDVLRLTKDYGYITAIQTLINLNIKEREEWTKEETAFFKKDSNVVDVVTEYNMARSIRDIWVEGLTRMNKHLRKERATPRS
jgi:hypothetical protein